MEVAEGIDQAGLAEAKGLDLRTHEHHTSGVGVEELVVEACTAILDIDGALYLFFHIGAVIVEPFATGRGR